MPLPTRNALLPKWETRMRYEPGTRSTARAREARGLQPGMNPSSLQASSFAIVPGHREWIETAVSGPVSAPALLRDPHAEMVSVPGWAALNTYQMSGLVSLAPQSPEPSFDAQRRLPMRVLPLKIGVALAQLSLAGATEDTK